MQLILASQSKGRKAMLSGANLKFECVPADLDEASIMRAMGDDTPEAIALHLAQAKALSVSQAHPGALVIGSDQVLDFDGQVLGKAKDEDEAIDRLRAMSGKSHRLISAVCVAQEGKILWHASDQANLSMHALSDEFLTAYRASAGEALTTSAGGYWLEDVGAHLFKRVDGDYFTVLGMPLLPLLAYLREEHGLGWDAGS
jgi:septum formation protein